MEIGPGNLAVLREALGVNVNFMQFVGPSAILDRVERLSWWAVSATQQAKDEDTAECLRALSAASEASEAILANGAISAEAKINALELIERAISGRQIAKLHPDVQAVTKSLIAMRRLSLMKQASNVRAKAAFDEAFGVPAAAPPSPASTAAAAPKAASPPAGSSAAAKLSDAAFVGIWTLPSIHGGVFEVAFAPGSGTQKGKFAARKTDGSFGHWGEWLFQDGGRGQPYLFLTNRGMMPSHFHGPLGSEKLNFPENEAWNIQSGSGDQFLLDQGPLNRSEQLEGLRITLRVSDMVAEMTQANQQLLMGAGRMQGDYSASREAQQIAWKSINSRRPS